MASAQINTNSITGFVWAPNRTVVAQVPVEVTNELGQVLQRTRTDGTGRYGFSGLSSGRFTVRVLPYGTNYEEQLGEVEIINIARGSGSTSDNAYKDFHLRVRKTEAGRAMRTGTVFAQEVPAEAKKDFEKALAEIENNRLDEGIQYLLAALKTFPDYHQALEVIGQQYMKKQNYEYAHAAFLKLVSVNERNFGGWYGLSYASYGLKNAEIAVAAAQKAVELEPGSVDAMLMLGISQRLAKRHTDAEKTLLQAKKLSKGEVADVHWNLALLYANNMNKYKEAADELELYLKVAPHHVKVGEVKKLIAKFREKAKTTANS